MKKKLPIGVQSFQKLRQNDFYYVDKTLLIKRLIDENHHVFLSRPPLFGKSLLISTIAELFNGNQSAFEGLAVSKSWEWEEEVTPVIQLSFNGGEFSSLDDLVHEIDSSLQATAERLDVSLPSSSKLQLSLSDEDCNLSKTFRELITLAHEKAGRRVVVLIDAYDQPVLQNLDNIKLAQDMAKRLSDLYSIIKENDEHIRFSMITGVTTLNYSNLFSGLNFLNDITLDPNYTSICGFTEKELFSFQPLFDRFNRTEISKWYKGYSWGGEYLFNPIDILQFLHKREFSSYWFDVSSPHLVIDKVIRDNLFTPRISHFHVNKRLLSTFEIDNLAWIPFLFQTGFITITKVNYLGPQIRYEIGFPNTGVQASFYDMLLHSYCELPERIAPFITKLYDIFYKNDFPQMPKLFNNFFQTLTPNHIKRYSSKYTSFYSNVFFAFFASLGLEIKCEETSSPESLDFSIKFNGYRYIFGFKVVEDSDGESPIMRLPKEDWVKAYRKEKEQLHIVGVEYSRIKREVVAFQYLTERVTSPPTRVSLALEADQ